MRKYLCVILLFCSFIIVKAQDPIFDLSYQNRLFMNPAFCGNDGSGRFRIASFNHEQFINNRGPFNFTSASVDYGICRTPLSIGLIALNENQGDGFLKTNAASLILGSGLSVTDFSALSVGIQFDILNYSVDWSKYVFSDQLDPIKGITQISSNSNAPIINQFTPGLSGGINYTKWNHRHTQVINGGLAFHQTLIRSQLALLSTTVQVPSRYTLHFGYLIKQNPNYIDNAKELTFRHDIQSNNNTSIFNFAYYINSTIVLGIGVRFSLYNQDFYKNSYKPIGELRIMPTETFKIVLSYGYNIANNSSGLGNAIELGIVFLPKAKYCNPLDVFKGGNAQSSGGVYNKKGKGKFGKGRQECPVYTKDKIIPTF